MKLSKGQKLRYIDREVIVSEIDEHTVTIDMGDGETRILNRRAVATRFRKPSTPQQGKCPRPAN